MDELRGKWHFLTKCQGGWQKFTRFPIGCSLVGDWMCDRRRVRGFSGTRRCAGGGVGRGGILQGQYHTWSDAQPSVALIPLSKLGAMHYSEYSLSVEVKFSFSGMQMTRHCIDEEKRLFSSHLHAVKDEKVDFWNDQDIRAEVLITSLFKVKFCLTVASLRILVSSAHLSGFSATLRRRGKSRVEGTEDRCSTEWRDNETQVQHISGDRGDNQWVGDTWQDKRDGRERRRGPPLTDEC